MFAKITLIGVFVSCLLLSKAQEWDFSYTHYTKEDGLPSNTIYCVTSDKNGVLWLGTDAGVVKFDGYNMKVFNTDDGLPSNDVFEIVCDSKNRLWLTTLKNEITFINNEKVHSKKNDPLIKEIQEMNSFPRVYEDVGKSLWIRSTPFKLCLVDSNNKVTKFNEFFNINTGCNISELNSRVYFVSAYSTIYYDKTSKRFTTIIPDQSILINGLSIKDDKCYYINNVNEISVLDTSFLSKGYFKSKSQNWNLPIKDSLLWLVCQRGFKSYNVNNFKYQNTLLNKFPASFFHNDKFENAWLATLNSGLFKLNSLNIKNSNQNSNIIFNSLTSIYVDSEYIIAGNIVGDVYFISRLTKQIIRILNLKFNSLTSFRVLKIINYKSKYYLATDRGIIEYDYRLNSIRELPLFHAAIKNVFFQGDTLITLDNDAIRFDNYKRNLHMDSIRTFKRFYSYCLYNSKKVFGSQDSIYYIDKVFKPYPLNINFNYRAVDLLVKDSLLIATTAEKGVFFIHDSTVVKNMNSSNGFSSNTCYKSVLYKDELYTATNKGINIYNFKTDSLFHLYESDGLPSNTVFDLKVFNDTIYAATESGLSVIPISVIPHQRSFPLFANPIVADQDTIWNRPDSISVLDNKPITMRLNALSYGTKSPVKYYYKLLPTDTSYHTTLDPQLHLNNLNHGNYTLQAYALNSDGVRSNLMLINISVIPYYYQTLLFKIAVAMFFILCIYLFTVWMVDRIKKKEKARNALETKIRNLELTGWRAAFNPHFLFNSIQTMQGLFLENDLERANKFTAEFSAILRKTVDNSGKLFISVPDEITYLQNYLDLEKIRGEQRFNYQIVAEENTKEYFVPTLVLQLVVENSLKHGIQDNIDGVISIVFELRDKKLVCTIQDNGRGFDERHPLKPDSKGMKLIKNKLDIVEKILGQQIPYHFTNRLNKDGEVIGTQTTFSFPLNIFDYDISSNDS